MNSNTYEASISYTTLVYLALRAKDRTDRIEP